MRNFAQVISFEGKGHRRVWPLVIFFVIILSVVFCYFASPFLEIPRVIVINSRPILVVISDFQGQKIVFFSLPTEAMAEVVGGYGRYRLGAVSGLGKIDNRRGGELLLGTMKWSLGLPIDGWIDFDEEISGFDRRYWQSVISRALSGRKEHGLSKKSLLSLWMMARKTNSVNFSEFKLGEGIFRENEIDVGKLSQRLKEIMPDSAVEKEAVSIGVANTTEHFGLGALAARVVENAGGRVLGIYSDSERVDYCRIFVSPEAKKSYTLAKMKLMFGCDLKIVDTSRYRVNILISLGEGFWRAITLR